MILGTGISLYTPHGQGTIDYTAGIFKGHPSPRRNPDIQKRFETDNFLAETTTLQQYCVLTKVSCFTIRIRYCTQNEYD